MKGLAADTPDEQKLDAAVPKLEADFAAHPQSTRYCFLRVPIRFDPTDVVNDDLGAITGLFYVLDAKADAAMRSGKVVGSESLACREDVLRLAHSLNHCGLLSEFFRRQQVGEWRDRGCLPRLTPDEISTAKDSDPNTGPLRPTSGAFRKHSHARANGNVEIDGWPNRIRCLFDSVTRQGVIDYCAETIYPRDQAVNRLLQVEMALRLYQMDHASLPTKLSGLVPSYQSNVPTDPFDGDAGTFCYELSDIGFKLWSVGPDGKDDGGAALAKERIRRHES